MGPRVALIQLSASRHAPLCLVLDFVVVVFFRDRIFFSVAQSALRDRLPLSPQSWD